ncbi:hypothetical protein [Streptomyces amritsarensis]|uniref:hypothetical protein n=1 Tax=Streptomyces amritsarensis TaxID=681158 RepID=UPI003685060E
MDPSLQHVSAFLREIYHCQERLGNFALALYLNFTFGEDASLIPQVLLRDHGQTVTLYQSIRIPDSQHEHECSEFNLTATLTVDNHDCTVETLVVAHLEQQFGETSPGIHTLHQTRDADLNLDGALLSLRARVDEMCELHDAPERIGFLRRP